MTIQELDKVTWALYGKPCSAHGVNVKLASLCKVSRETVAAWKARGHVPAGYGLYLRHIAGTIDLIGGKLGS